MATSMVNTDCSNINTLIDTFPNFIKKLNVFGKVWWGSLKTEDVTKHLLDADIGDALITQGVSNVDTVQGYGVVCSVFVKTEPKKVLEFRVIISAGSYICHVNETVYNLGNTLTTNVLFDVIHNTLGYSCKPIQMSDESQGYGEVVNQGYKFTRSLPMIHTIVQLNCAWLKTLLWETPMVLHNVKGRDPRNRRYITLADTKKYLSSFVRRDDDVDEIPVALVHNRYEAFAGYLFSYVTTIGLWAAVVLTNDGFSVIKYNKGKISNSDDDYITSGWNLEYIIKTTMKAYNNGLVTDHTTWSHYAKLVYIHEPPY